MKYFRSWIGFGNLFPISASKAIVEKHYKTNVKFARAEDEMRVCLRNVIQGRPSIHPIGRRERAIKDKTSSPVVLITRLTQQQITKALAGDFSDWLNLPIKKVSTAKYNLRKRK